jgi:putative FmdB family regulatory protein
MPLYDFHCKDCGRDFSIAVESEDLKRSFVCPNCSSDHVERLQEVQAGDRR